MRRNKQIIIRFFTLYLYLIFIIFFNCSNDKDNDKTDLVSKGIPADIINMLNSNEKIISVMTYNIRRNGDVENQPHEDDWENTREDRVIELIQEYNPHIFCLQEVDNDEQYDDIRNAFSSNYGYIGGKSNSEDERCPIFYKRDEFDLLQSGSIYLAKEYYRIRVCTFVKLQLNLSSGMPGPIFYVFNTHYTGGDSYDQVHQLQSSKDIRYLLGTEGVNNEDGHVGLNLDEYTNVILAGDFNVMSTEDPYLLLTNIQSVDDYSYYWPLEDSYKNYYQNIEKAETAHGGLGWDFICRDLSGEYSPGADYCVNWAYGDNRIDYIFHSQFIETLYSKIITDNYWIDYENILPLTNVCCTSACGLSVFDCCDECEWVNRASDHDPIFTAIELNPSTINDTYRTPCHIRPELNGGVQVDCCE